MAITFASGDYIQNPNNTVISGAALGAVAWRMRSTQTTSNVCILSKTSATNSAGGFSMLLNNTAGKLTVQGKTTGAAQRVLMTGAAVLNDGNWHNCVYNWNQNANSPNTIYVDGAQDVTSNSSATSPWPFGSDTFRHGKSNDSFWANYVGELAEVAWFDRNLTLDDIVALYKGFSPRSMRPRLYMPLIRPIIDILGPVPTVNGTSVSAHPRII